MAHLAAPLKLLEEVAGRNFIAEVIMDATTTKRAVAGHLFCYQRGPREVLEIHKQHARHQLQNWMCKVRRV